MCVTRVWGGFGGQTLVLHILGVLGGFGGFGYSSRLVISEIHAYETENHQQRDIIIILYIYIYTGGGL
jgi:hypothetical protein